MKRLFPFIVVGVFCIIGYRMLTADKAQTAQALAMQAMAAGITAQPTETPLPLSPTVDHNGTSIAYQNEAIHARETAVQAMAVNAQVTAEYEQRVQEQLILTSQAEYINFQVLGWTQTAAPTSVAMTSTAQLLILGNQTMVSSQMTATAQAPTLIVAMADSQNHAKHVETAYILEWVLKLAVAFFVVVLSVFLIWKMKTVKAADIMHDLQKEDAKAQYKAPGIVLQLSDEKTPEKTEHYTLPCSWEQLSELAEMVVNGAKTFPYNHMEENSRTFKNRRNDLRAVRDVLDKARLVVTNARTGEGVVSERGGMFFEWVFENKELPDGYELDDVSPPPSAEDV